MNEEDRKHLGSCTLPLASCEKVSNIWEKPTPDAATSDMTREVVMVCSSGKSNDPKAALLFPHHSHDEQVTQKCPSLEDILQGQKEGLVASPEGKAKGMDEVETLRSKASN